LIRYIYADDLTVFPKLRHSMFVDRASQFKTRLNWEVAVDDTGYEMDEYDLLNPMYVIWQMPDGSHGGSMRLLPTVGKTMVNDHFLDLTALLCAGCELGLQFGLSDSVGVYDPRMTRIYRRIGWEPTCLGTKGAGKEKISVGLWEVSETARDAMCLNGGWSNDTPAAWFEASFPSNAPAKAA